MTALIVQDEFGGSLWRVVNCGVSHYYNLTSTGEECDLTRDQFDAWEPSPAELRTREYVLSNPDTARRSRLLRRQVDELL